jgi:hypothetical protein
MVYICPGPCIIHFQPHTVKLFVYIYGQPERAREKVAIEMEEKLTFLTRST